MSDPELTTATGPELRVMVVDDDGMWRYLIASALRERGFVVQESEGAGAMLEALAGFQPMVLVIDALMPDVDGFALCQAVREGSVCSDIPIMIMTSLEDDRAITRAYDAGATDFFIKSTHWTLLAERLRQLVRMADRVRVSGLGESRGAVADADPLTGLAGRGEFLRRLESVLCAYPGRELTLAKIDLDRFARINETLGQAAGDDLLRQVAERLALLDPLELARLPGDEFVLLLDDGAVVASAPDRLEALRDVFRMPFARWRGVLRVGLDRGGTVSRRRRCRGIVAGLRGVGGDSSQVAGEKPHTDFRGRRFGRRASTRLELANALHRALGRAELSLHYQPVVDCDKQRVSSLEALMRWQYRGSWIPPGEFIPLAEESGLIIPFGEWAIQTALSQLAAWRRDGLEIGAVAINVPAAHLCVPSLLPTIRSVLRENGLTGDSLIVEVTETGVMLEIDQALETLDLLSAMGVRLAIDDFGTGHSSLSRLTRLPIDTLKIDRSFVTQMEVSREDLLVARAIVSLARGLSIDVVAEGVETDSQLRTLHALGCRLIQGYLFSRPQPAEAVPATIERIDRMLGATGVRGGVADLSS
ncbi:MAG: EAL domain-containing protein [Burkholderiaceae bacterium]